MMGVFGMLRLGIIGAGGIASLHTHNILSGKCS